MKVNIFLKGDSRREDKSAFHQSFRWGKFVFPTSGISSHEKLPHLLRHFFRKASKQSGKNRRAEWVALGVHSLKLTWQWKKHHWIKMYLLLKNVILQCHVSFQGYTLKFPWQKTKTLIFRFHHSKPTLLWPVWAWWWLLLHWLVEVTAVAAACLGVFFVCLLVISLPTRSLT